MAKCLKQNLATAPIIMTLFHSESDLTHEAENLLQFDQDFSGDNQVVFPIPILELCHPNVIVETFESGVPLSSVVNRLEEMSTGTSTIKLFCVE